MDLKVRFSLYFSLVLCLLLAGFSFAVYGQLQKKLIASSAQSLSAALEHEWRHLELGNGLEGDFTHTLHTKNVYIRIWRDGTLIRDSFPPVLRQLSPEALEAPEERLVQRSKRELDGAEYVLLGVFDLANTDAYLHALGRVLLLGCFLAALLILPLSWALTKSLLLPFSELSQKTRELDARRLSFRFHEPRRRDEYGILVRSINSLLTRLEKSFNQTRRFATNASHELRTPLTVIRGEAELMLRRERSPGDYQVALQSILQQAETLQGIVSRLLFLADLERMEQEGNRTAIDVGKTISETLKYIQQAHAGAKRKVEIQGAAIVFQGDRELFTSLVGNLIENAIKYSSNRVLIRYGKGMGGLNVEVEDDGPGIPEDKRDQAFEPFFKRAESRHAQGHGIGLSIVKSCIEVAKGRIGLGTSVLGGLLVQVYLPEPA